MDQSHGREGDLEAGDGHYPSNDAFRPWRWMQAALVSNASRRFRYTRDLNNEEQVKITVQKIRAQFQATRAAQLFQAEGQQANGISKTPTRSGNFGISQEQLAVMTRDRDVSTLGEYGGVEQLAKLLKTDLHKGIHGDCADLLARQKTYRKEGSFWMSLWKACQNLALIIPTIAAVALLVLGIMTKGIKEGWYDGGSIAFAVILIIVVTAISDYRQSPKFQRSNEDKRNIHLEVVRSGRQVKVSIDDVVVGDVVLLDIGDWVPADGVWIPGHSLAIDESSMTAESKIVHKDAIDPFLMSGHNVSDRQGKMLVTRVGNLEDTREETHLQVQSNGVATCIGVVGLFVAVAVLVVLLARFFTGYTKNPDGTVQYKAGQTSVTNAVDGVIEIATVAVTIVAVAIPEGLLLAVPLILACPMRKMMDRVLVRRPSALETMGSVKAICCDKTGTLTLNQMTVVEAYACGRMVNPLDSNSQLSPSLISLLTEGIAQKSNGSVYVPESRGAVDVSGSPTEEAILQWGSKLGMNFEAIRSRSSRIRVFPFNSEKKRGGAAVKLRDSAEVRIHWQGAAEIVLASCTKYMDANDQVAAMGEDKKMYFRKAIQDMADGGLCCVAIAYRPYDIKDIPLDEEQLTKWALSEDELILLAIVGMKDPCRPGVKDAVKRCQNAGVKIRMFTGDNIQTAKAIALECGILESEADATARNLIKGGDFRILNEAARVEAAENISVIAESSPNDKLLLVQALRKREHIVAVTGDGINDASALQEADIGIALAMGIQGTEVMKDSSDIIISDDYFASVVEVIREGRSVYANIQKFIQSQLTVNVAALFINVFAAVSSGDVPLNAVQLLWVNLITNTLGALALVTKPPTNHLMQSLPVGRREPLITDTIWNNICIQAGYQVSALLLLDFRGRSLLNLEHDTSDHANKVINTLIFNTSVFCQIKFNLFNGIRKNRLFMGTVALILILQVIIIEFLGKFTSTVRLDQKQWILSIIIAFMRSVAGISLVILMLAFGCDPNVRRVPETPNIGRMDLE